MRTLQTAF